MISFVISIITAAIFALRLIQAKNAQMRGTNTFTRFVRDSANNGVITMVMAMSGFLGVILCLTGMVGESKEWWAGFPNILVAALAVVFMIQSTKNQQRKKDARVVTKTSLQVGGKTAGVVVGTAAGVAAGVTSGGVAAAAGAKLGKEIGDGIGGVVSQFGDAMDDVEAPDIDCSKLIEKCDPERIVQMASSVGIPCEGMDLQNVAAELVKNIPDHYKQKYPELAPVDLALKVVNGEV